ncbi:unnamed protein product [Caenorhabditis angaria]|uniref:Uncharacterized protein n=1 Tax=Caenorhabditis angaria TaxID=860376 RepID=A0A9P1MWF4_9PELO|nr:unnamed protein product [Caenorhabditis angaria]
MRLLFLVFIFSINSCLTQHVDFVYKFSTEENKILSEKIEIFSKFVSNDNRFLTTEFKLEQGNDEKLIISGENIKLEFAIQELGDVQNFLLDSFQKYSNEYYNQIALKSWSNELKFPRRFEEFEITSEYELNKKLSNNFYVLYYLNENFESWKAILHFVNALKKSKKEGGIINCFENSDLCKAHENLNSPILESFHQQEQYLQFKGTFENDNVFDWIQTLEQPDITSLSENAVPYYREGMIPGFEDTRDTVTMLFIPSKKSVVYQNYAKFARENHGRFHLCAMVSEEVKKWAHQPAFITMKPRDEFIKAFTLFSNITWNSMTTFLEEGQHPSVHEITNAQQLSYALVKTSKPLVIFYDPLKLKDSTSFRKYASNHQSLKRDAFFGLIQKLDVFGLYLGQIFEVTEPSYLVIRETDTGYCIITKKISSENENQLVSFVHKLVSKECEKTLDSTRLPLNRLNKYEMLEEVKELEIQILSSSSHEEL